MVPWVVFRTAALTPSFAPLIASATPCGVSVPTLMCVVVLPTVRSRPAPAVIGSVAVKPRAVVTCALASAVTSNVKVPVVAPEDAVATTAGDEEGALADCHVGVGGISGGGAGDAPAAGCRAVIFTVSHWDAPAGEH